MCHLLNSQTEAGGIDFVLKLPQFIPCAWIGSWAAKLPNAVLLEKYGSPKHEHPVSVQNRLTAGKKRLCEVHGGSFKIQGGKDRTRWVMHKPTVHRNVYILVRVSIIKVKGKKKAKLYPAMDKKGCEQPCLFHVLFGRRLLLTWMGEILQCNH